MNSPSKILLIEPPFYRLYKNEHQFVRYPLSLGYLAGAIKKETNWKVIVYNGDFYPKTGFFNIVYMIGEGFYNYLDNIKNSSRPIWEEMRLTIKEYMPDVVGISANSANFSSACIIAKTVKDFNNKTIVVIGGPHPSAVGSEVLNCPDIDVAVIGEGEKTIVELLSAIELNSCLDSVKGIAYRKNGAIIETPKRELIENLDILCFPNEIAPEVLKDYKIYPKDAFKSIFATRGCPYECFFALLVRYGVEK